MKLIRQPNKWSCTAAAFAMVLDIDFDIFIGLIGHDGSEIVRPQLPEPLCRRGFHIIECIHACYDLGYSVTPFDAIPCSIVHNHILDLWSGDIAEKHLLKIIMREQGVIMGYTSENNPHAVAWDRTHIYNPASDYVSLLDLTSYKIETFWCVKSNHN